jgi:hypothetical protein
MYENDEKYQLDATIVIYYHKVSLHVSGIYMPIFRSTGCVTAPAPWNDSDKT